MFKITNLFRAILRLKFGTEVTKANTQRSQQKPQAIAQPMDYSGPA